LQKRKLKTNLWRIIAKSLGEKSGKNDKESDKIALIRLMIMIQLIVTNGFIIANAIRHWNDINYSNLEKKCLENDRTN
jgi:hypothetical protein